MKETLFNSLVREGPTVPVKMSARDFIVHRTEHMTQASTVLMIDMSRSMFLRGCFLAAKKVAIALDSLIRSQYPRDSLYVVGFSNYAVELKPQTLPQLALNDYVYGTNMQHGFQLARSLLAKHRGNRQVIMITDGEPTAHLRPDGRLSADLQHDPADAERGEAVYARPDRDQHVHARARALPDRVHQPDDPDQQGKGVLRLA